ncbi:MAG: TadE/TadG family type IV pilus assembly protein [Beijerinckiaceae bacterium]
MISAIRSMLMRGVRLSSRFRKREDGSAAVEFAIVSLPFFGLMFAVIELSIFFFASRFLEDSTFDIGRRALTQSLNPASSCTDFRTQLTNRVSGWFDPSQLVVSVKVLNSFGSAGTPVDFNNPSCSFGTTGQILLIETSYPYPFTAFRLYSGTPGSGIAFPLRAATALRVE